MKTSQMIIRGVAACLCTVIVACSGATEPGNSPEITRVVVELVPAPLDLLCDCSYWGGDTVKVAAVIRDGHDRPITGRSVTWQLQWADGTEVGDTIASIAPTGVQTASAVFRSQSPALFAIVGSVVGNDGLVKSGKVFLSWP